MQHALFKKKTTTKKQTFYSTAQLKTVTFFIYQNTSLDRDVLLKKADNAVYKLKCK